MQSFDPEARWICVSPGVVHEEVQRVDSRLEPVGDNKMREACEPATIQASARAIEQNVGSRIVHRPAAGQKDGGGIEARQIERRAINVVAGRAGWIEQR